MTESLGASIGGPGAFVLVLARSAGLVWGLAWLAGASGAGFRSRMAASALLAAAVAPAVGAGAEPPADALALGGSAVAEAVAGAGLGVVAGLVVAAARLAGELIGAQAGLSAASALAPESADGVETPVATLAGLVALATFAALDGPLRLALALADSYAIGPGPVGAAPSVGVGPAGEAAARSAFAVIGQALGLALWLAAPVALSLLVAQLAVGVLARGAPALSNFLAWLPARLVLGLVLLLIGLAAIASGLASAWSAALPGG